MDLTHLLAPITPEQPCGEDLAYSPERHELETLLQGTSGTDGSLMPESQAVQLKTPNWKAVQDQAIALLERTKHLKVAIYLVSARFALSGFAGFAEGLTYLRQLLIQYWENLYPEMEDGDPGERVDLLQLLIQPEGKPGDSLQFIGRLRREPLSRSSQWGEYSLAQVQAALQGKTTDKGDKPIDPKLVEASFRDTAPELLTQIASALNQAQDEVVTIDRFLGSKVGAKQTANFEVLAATLRDAEKAVRPYVPTALASHNLTNLPENGAGDTGAPAETRESAKAVRATPGVSIALSTIQSRQDVLAALDAICKYYDQVEPSSPVLPVLRRCQQLVGKTFIELLQELGTEGTAKLELKAPEAKASED